MTATKYVCIDLDGTIAHYETWKGEEHFGKPIEGVQAALERLRSAGWEIIIHTTRVNQKLVEYYLQSNAIPFDHFNENPTQPNNAIGGKPIAHAYIDDRGIQFNGDWQTTVNEVLQFVPWEKRKKPGFEAEYRKEAISFLGRDYEEVFDQLRAYDTQIWEILKYSFGQLLTSIAAVWVIFTLANETNPPSIMVDLWKLVSAIVLLISFSFGILAIYLILRNRCYFSAAARYLNDQRDHFLSSKPLGFSNRSLYYTDFEYPKPFDANSSQIIYIYVIALISSLLFGLGAGFFANFLGVQGTFTVVSGVVVWLVSLGLTVWGALHYLQGKSQARSGSDAH